MKNLVIVSFPAKAETLDQLKELLKAALPDTRSFAGCISVSTYIEESSNTGAVTYKGGPGGSRSLRRLGLLRGRPGQKKIGL